MGRKGAKQTGAASAFRDQVVEALRPLGDVTSRSMFGGFGIFESGDMFAIVDSEAQLYFKADGSTKARYEAAGSKQHRPMPYFEVPADVVEDEASLIEWASEAAQVAHATKKR
ncbi:MAG: TfoX/Sxy family protein [Chloroflexi bacterium]|nr:TfoX/Sxy family protein [Chloroflexota bacterium]MDA1296730.1 TfoX/Sxy family protein [Chloroflexota bacterium]